MLFKTCLFDVVKLSWLIFTAKNLPNWRWDSVGKITNCEGFISWPYYASESKVIGPLVFFLCKELACSLNFSRSHCCNFLEFQFNLMNYLILKFCWESALVFILLSFWVLIHVYILLKFTVFTTFSGQMI